MSLDRLSTYKILVGGNLEKAFKLYVWNIALSESLYVPIQGFEITLRNAFHDCLSTGVGNNWFDMLHLQSRELEQIAKVKSYLYTMGKPLVPPNIIAAINFGFWAGILDRLYENNLWRPYLHQVFKNAPGPLRRKEIFVTVDRIRRLRNRIAHHEPILRRNLQDDNALMLQLIGWICKDTASWVQHHSRFEEVWKNFLDDDCQQSYSRDL